MVVRSPRLRWVGGAAIGAAGGAAAGCWVAILVALLLYVAADGQLSSTALLVAGCIGGGAGVLAGLAIGPAWALRGRRPGRYNHATDVWGRPLAQSNAPRQPKTVESPSSLEAARREEAAPADSATQDAVDQNAAAEIPPSVVSTPSDFVHCTTGRLRVTGVVDTSAYPADDASFGVYPLR